MKIPISHIKTTPKNMDFNLCIWDKPSEELSEWINYWKLKTTKSGNFTNIVIDDNNISNMFIDAPKFKYVDGFSPNLNKNLHLGHLSNLVIAKSFQSIGIGEKFISILGDTLDGEVKKEDALNSFKNYCDKFNYKVDDIYFASEQVLKNLSLLENGAELYDGTKVFDIDGVKIVGIKSNGSTSYFYQDVALAEKLSESTLYLTGFEQDEHFKNLNKLFPNNQHIGLGLVTINGKKMSSSEGNVIMADEVFNIIKSKFNDDEKLAWNVLCGYILKYEPKSVKDINLNAINNVKSSQGLYLSYTLAKMKSAGMVPNKIFEFNSNSLKFKLLKAKISLSPNILFEELIENCKKISQLYVEFKIKDNIENQKMFQPLLDDLLFGMGLLGMFDVDKV